MLFLDFVELLKKHLLIFEFLCLLKSGSFLRRYVFRRRWLPPFFNLLFVNFFKLFDPRLDNDSLGAEHVEVHHVVVDEELPVGWHLVVVVQVDIVKNAAFLIQSPWPFLLLELIWIVLGLPDHVDGLIGWVQYLYV